MLPSQNAQLLPSLTLSKHSWFTAQGYSVRQPTQKTLELVGEDISQHFLIGFDEQHPDKVDVVYIK